MCFEKNLSVSLIFTPTSVSFYAWLHRINIGLETAVMTGQRTYKPNRKYKFDLAVGYSKHFLFQIPYIH